MNSGRFIGMKPIKWIVPIAAAIGIVIFVLLNLHFPRDRHREFRSAHPQVTVLSAEVVKLHEMAPPPKPDTDLAREVESSPVLHDYPIKLPWHTIAQLEHPKIQNLMMDPSLYDKGGLADCFFPGFAVRLKTDPGEFTILVCLKCDRIEVIPPDGNGHHLPMSDLGTLHWKAFFVDEFILRPPPVETR